MLHTIYKRYMHTLMHDNADAALEAESHEDQCHKY